MAIEAAREASPADRRIRLGMVGGGEGAFIGAVHRIAARLDDQYELVAGALSSEPGRALRSGEAIGLARAYPDYMTMAREEAAAPTASKRWPSSRRTTSTRRPPRPSCALASTSSATSR